MDGFGSHTFQWVNAAAERFWVKFHFKTDQGIRYLTSPEAETAGGKDPAFLQKDLYEAIGRGDFPSWTLKVQVMREQNASSYRFNPFDLTKVWPYRDHPLVPIARLVLNRVPDNYFADVEQAAFDPANFVPGIGPSPDRMLQARLFAYGDAHRYRLGINHTRLPVNAPRVVDGGARNYGRDGAMRFDANGARAKNYEPNSFGEPVQTSEAYEHGLALSGTTGPSPRAVHVEDDDFSQAGALYRVMPEEARKRLVENIAGSLSQVSRKDVIERSVAHFRKADPEYGQRVADAVARRRP